MHWFRVINHWGGGLVVLFLFLFCLLLFLGVVGIGNVCHILSHMIRVAAVVIVVVSLVLYLAVVIRGIVLLKANVLLMKFFVIGVVHHPSPPTGENESAVITNLSKGRVGRKNFGIITRGIYVTIAFATYL